MVREDGLSKREGTLGGGAMIMQLGVKELSVHNCKHYHASGALGHYHSPVRMFLNGENIVLLQLFF